MGCWKQEFSSAKDVLKYGKNVFGLKEQNESNRLERCRLCSGVDNATLDALEMMIPFLSIIREEMYMISYIV